MLHRYRSVHWVMINDLVTPFTISSVTHAMRVSSSALESLLPRGFWESCGELNGIKKSLL